MSDTYQFKKAQRLISIQLSHDGKVLPFVKRRNGAGVLVPYGAPVEEATLADGEEFRFDVHVPLLPDAANEGLVSHEFANWGPRIYKYTSAYFLGLTWPFGTDEYKSEGPSLDSGHVEKVSYTFKQIDRPRGDTVKKVWALSWASEAGFTKLDGSVDIVAEKTGGSLCYVVLRLANNCSGSIDLATSQFGANKSFFAEASDAEIAGSTAAVPSAPATPAAPADTVAPSGLSAALSKVYRDYQAHWEAVKAAKIPQEYLDPIQRAVSDHATKSALAALSKFGSAQT